jgi:hypothetical protein
MKDEENVEVEADVDADAEVDATLQRLSRRGFITAGIAATAGYGAYKWLRSRPREDGVEWPLRRALVANEPRRRGSAPASGHPTSPARG